MSRTQVRTLYMLSMIAVDMLMAAAAFLLGYRARQLVPFPTTPLEIVGFANYLPMLVVQVVTVVVVFYVNRLYHVARAHSRADMVYSVFAAVSVATMLSVAISAMTFKNTIFELDFPRAMVLYAWLLGVILIALGRETHRIVWHQLRARGIGHDQVLIVGSGEAAEAIVRLIQLSPGLGYDLVGVVNTNGNEHRTAGVKVLGNVSDLADILEQEDVQEIIIALPEGTDRYDIARIVSMCQRGSISIKIYPDLFEFITTGITIDDLGGIPLLNVRDIQLRGWRLSLKRGIDMIGAILGLVILSPLMMLFAFLIRLESPGSVFYCQERMGLDGQAFQMIKYRSMRQDAEKDGPGWTTKNDPRRTKLGAWLRSKNIDELPQLINVLLGEMSLVGPRPERPIYVQKFRQSIPRYMERHREKAGMAGWAQVNGLRGDSSIAERTKYDLWYVENWSIWLDIRIIARAVWQTLFQRDSNAY
ncbi:MAG: undecaprenyl-phosphate glucose phosphotransferase [Anaerolineae bacterium]|nr:undecaprenyl-phosphate glucose phosphotransferase [Anaerolineae bacterium]